jgi:putative membrane protein
MKAVVFASVTRQRIGDMRIVMIILYLALILVGVTFAVLNASSVQVNLYLTTLTMPISVLMTLMLGVGMVLGFVLFLWRYIRLKNDHRNIKNQLRLTEKEIKNLRAIPLKDQQ